MSAYDTPEKLVKIVSDALDIGGDKDVPTKLGTANTAIFGWTSVGMMHFLNTICSHGDCNYLEFGVWCGRSLCAAGEGNTGRFVGVDCYEDSAKYFLDGCEIQSLKPLQKIAVENVAARPHSELVIGRSAEYVPTGPVNVFYYDGDHEYAPTRDAVIQIAPYLRPGIFLMDDFIWEHVYTGTVAGLKDSGLAIHASWFLSPNEGYNSEGVFAAVVSQR